MSDLIPTTEYREPCTPEQAAADASLRHSETTDTLLVAYNVGHADTPAGRLTVLASGSVVRFTLDGTDGYVDLDLSGYAAQALQLLTGAPVGS